MQAVIAITPWCGLLQSHKRGKFCNLNNEKAEISLILAENKSLPLPRLTLEPGVQSGVRMAAATSLESASR